MLISETHNTHCEKIMAQYPDGYFDWGLIDIPWGINVGNMSFIKNSSKKVVQKSGKILPVKGKKLTNKDWDLVPPTQAYYDELCRITNNQIIFGIDYVNWENVGTGRIVWDKMVADGMSFNRYEVAYCSSIDYTHEIKLLWSGMMQAKSLHEPTIQQGNKRLNEERIHICHKPVLLYKRLLLDFVAPGKKVIDTHLGSGSSRIACYDYGCDFVGCEVDKEYFEDQEMRFKTYTNQLRINFNHLDKKFA